MYDMRAEAKLSRGDGGNEQEEEWVRVHEGMGGLCLKYT